MRKYIFKKLSLGVTLAALTAGCATQKDAGAPALAASPSPWQKLTSSMANGSRRVADSVTPKAQVAKAKDPTSLSTPTGKLGADIYVHAAKIHENKGDQAAAAAQYEKALKVDGNDLAALLGYGHLLDRQKKFTEATLYYERATKAHPQSPSAWNDLGLCYSRRAQTEQGMIEKSVAALRKAVELKPEKALYRNNIAAVLASAGRDGEAFSHLVAVHDPATAHYNLGYLLNQQNKVDLAARHFAEALRHNPQMPAARAYLDQLGRRDSAVAGHHSAPQYAPRKLTVPTPNSTTDQSVLVPATAPKAPIKKAAARQATFDSTATKAASDVVTASAELPVEESDANLPDAPEPASEELLDAPLP